MKINKKLTFTALAALAVALVVQTSITRADAQGKRDQHGQQAQVTFTKCVTFLPASPCPPYRADMAGVVGGEVGEGIFTGKLLVVNAMDVEAGVAKLEALYHFEGSEHSFTALVHIEQRGSTPGSKAVISGVVTQGWLKGHAVEGEFTAIGGGCFEGTLAIARDSRDSIDN